MTSENLKMNEVVQDATSPEKKGDGAFSVEIVKSPENSQVVDKVQDLESAISHDIPLTIQQILEAEKSLNSMKVVVGGDEMTIAEMKEIPDLEMNMKIFAEIEVSNCANSRNLTYITPHIAKLITSHLGRTSIWLDGLTSISDDAAECLGVSDSFISLCGLTSISEITAGYLSKHSNNGLFLNGLTSISDSVAEQFSEHRGELQLSGLMSISDSVAEKLCKNGRHLSLRGLTSISDAAARFLAQRSFYDLTVPDVIRHRIESFKKLQP